MKPNTQKRIFRAFVTSLLASDMTEAELREILSTTTHDSELAHEIKRGVAAALGVLHASDVHKEESFQPRYEDPAETAYDIIKRRRLSKSSVFETIKMTIGNKVRRNLSDDLTMRELLVSFYSVASKREQEMFVDLLGYGSSKDDAFLQGILRKR